MDKNISTQSLDTGTNRTRTELPESRYRLLINAQRFVGDGNVSKAVGTLYQFADERTTYWPTIFSWAISPKKIRSRYEEYLKRPLRKKDYLQIQRDLPRTRDWLYYKRECENSNQNETKSPSEVDMDVELQEKKLQRVLHAYTTSMYDGEEDDSGDKGSIYVQGMNGVAFVLLDVLNGNEKDAFTYLRGICTNLLPGLFDGTRTDDFLGQDNMARMSEYYDSLLSEFYPIACEKCNSSGLPVGTLALKWMLTLFSNLSFSGGDDTLQYKTILAAWDICFLMGMAGVTAVVLSLFGFAAPEISNLEDDPTMIEKIIDILRVSLKRLPDSILYNQCADLLTDECIHPKLRILRDAHAKRVKKFSVKLRRKLSYDIQPDSLLNDPNRNKGGLNIRKTKNRIHPDSHVLDGNASKYEDFFVGEQNRNFEVKHRHSDISLDSQTSNRSDLVESPSEQGENPPVSAELEEVENNPRSTTGKKKSKKKKKKKKKKKAKDKQKNKDNIINANTIEEKEEAEEKNHFSPQQDYIEEWTDLRQAPQLYQKENQEADYLTVTKSKTEEQYPGFAHDWIEAWDDQFQAHYYYHARISSKRSWEPPPQGYISMSGLLMLQNGKLAENS